jgi:hypothetical protein
MRRVLSVVLVAMALSAAATPVPTEAAAHLAPGARIRWVAVAEPARLLVGKEIALRSDTLFAEGVSDSPSYALPLSSLASLEVSRGRQSRSPRYALMGAVVGSLTVVAVVRLALKATSEVFTDATGLRVEQKDEFNYVPAALIGAGLGATCGAVIGAVRRGPETWESVDLSQSPVGVIFRIGGNPALGLSLRF